MSSDSVTYDVIYVFHYFLLQCKLNSNHAGWKTLMVPQNDRYSVIKIELKGNQNNIRARQVIILGRPAKPVSNACLKTTAAMQKDCEAEALRLFRLLTSQVNS